MTFLKRMSNIHLCQKTLGKKRQEESQLFKTPLLGKTMARVGEIRFLGLLIKAFLLSSFKNSSSISLQKPSFYFRWLC